MNYFAKTIGAALLLVALVAGTALAANPATGKSSITAFGDGATQTSKTSVTITNAGDLVGFAYIPGFNSSFYGVRTALVTALSNTVTGSALGIDPHWSIPIDNTAFNLVDGNIDGFINAGDDGYTDYWLYVPFATCNNGFGFVDVINDTTCTIYDSRDALVSYANWAAFVVADGNTNIALLDNYAFVIADGSGAEGTWTISNMKVGKPGK